MCSMRLELSMKQKLATELRMAPHIIQSIEILTLPTLELETFIQQQMETNPTLELKEPTVEQESSSEENEDSESSEDKSTKSEEIDNKESKSESSEEDESETEKVVDDDFLRDFENIENEDWNDFYAQNRVDKRVSNDEKDKKLEAMQNSADKPVSLQDYLFQQFQVSEVPENLKEIGKYIIYNIDSNGYLRYSLEEIVKSMEPSPSMDNAERALEYIQRLEPTGVGARSMQECLILQLEKDSPDYVFKRDLIQKYLNDIYNNRYPKIAKETGKDIDEIKDAVRSIQRLNPKPGAEYSCEKAQFIKPDVVVELIEGEYVIRLEGDYFLNLQINPFYEGLLAKAHQNKNKEINPKEKDFIKKKLESAHWVIDAIRQRQETLKRVVEQLVQHQREFLDYGLTYLKSLKMQEIADTLGIHVSTVSRAISGKYIQTPRGIFPIKFFFTGSIEKKDGENEATVCVKQRINEIIEKEDKGNPLSDEEVVEKLKEFGLEIARRTITKYRKALGIPSSRRRKKY